MPGNERTDDERAQLNRRRYLKAAATTAAIGVAGVGTAAATPEYDVIRVPAGRTHTIRLRSDESLENTVIDITARRAKYQITAIGSGWTIRNVGVRGSWDDSQKAEPLIAGVPNRNGIGRIENLYLGDGADDDVYPGATGIYVTNNHAGRLLIDRANIQGYPDNAIYGSSPGDLPRHPSGRGGGGTVEITNSYAANCRAGGFRVGTDGSFAENCVAVGCDRNFWGFYGDTEIVDCDFSNGRFGDVGTGDSHWRSNARVRVRSSRFNTTVQHSGRVVGSSAGSPRRTRPEEVDGVPLSAEDAATGGRESPPEIPDEGDEDQDDDEPADDQPDEDEPPTDDEGGYLLAFVTDPDASMARYSFTADGAVSFTEAPYESPSGNPIVGGSFRAEDFVEETDDGWEAGGVTGGGFGDAFRVDGPVTAIDLESPHVMWVELDGERRSLEEIYDETADEAPENDGPEDDEDPAPADRLVAFVTEPEASMARYEFTADGPVAFTEAPYESPSGNPIVGGSFRAEDYVEETDDGWEAGGVTGGGFGDAFTVEGSITSLTVDQPDVMWVEVDGERRPPEEIVDGESPPDDEADDQPNEDPEEGTDDEPPLPRAIVIDATDVDEPAEYRFSVSGEVAPSTYREATINEDATIDDDRVSATVAGSRDAYRFSGDLTGFWLNGDASVDVVYDA